MSFNYGIMQGRLSPIINNKIQAFPEKYWKTEFSKAKKLGFIIGLPIYEKSNLFNAAAIVDKGELIGFSKKVNLPNYSVFDEKRVFDPGPLPGPINFRNVRIGVPICEDIWTPDVVECIAETGGEILLVPNGSPFETGKSDMRIHHAVARVVESGLPLVYLNQIGGQDELVFDGGSFAVNADGELAVVAPDFEEGCFELWVERTVRGVAIAQGVAAAALSDVAAVWQALVLGVRDYVEKNGFPGVVLGLSGGIDSAVTLAVAVDALGADRVQAVMMPFKYTADMSVEDAGEQASVMGVEYDVISIEPIYEAFMSGLTDQFDGLSVDTTEENLQARCRGVLLMSISNKKNRLVLTTGNKSELAVGYSTLYGDMAGGFDPLKDCPKLLVYALAQYRNTLGYCIPQRVIDRPPSAELAPDQTDQDNLPPYDQLDEIIERYVEEDQSAEQIVAEGFAESDVKRVIRLIDLNEYKRRQAPVGVRITTRGFGRDRRYPISWAWRKS